MKGLKPFALKICLFALPLVLDLTVYTWYFYHNDKYQQTVASKTVYEAIKKSKQRKKAKKLILGDSVAYLLFPWDNSDVSSLACVQGVSFAGYYILLKNFLETNHDSLPDKVIILFHPTVLVNNLDQRYTYNDFLKPFYCRENMPYFTETVFKQVHQIPYYYLSQFPLIKISNWAVAPRQKAQGFPGYMSPITKEYLVRIKNLCDSLHVNYFLVPPPINSIMRHKIEEARPVIRKEAAQLNMQVKFDIYLNNIQYMDSSLYRDERHFKKDLKVNTEYILNLAE
jgi:hypothetical protein